MCLSAFLLSQFVNFAEMRLTTFCQRQSFWLEGVHRDHCVCCISSFVFLISIRNVFRISCHTTLGFLLRRWNTTHDLERPFSRTNFPESNRALCWQTKHYFLPWQDTSNWFEHEQRSYRGLQLQEAWQHVTT